MRFATSCPDQSSGGLVGEFVEQGVVGARGGSADVSLSRSATVGFRERPGLPEEVGSKLHAAGALSGSNSTDSADTRTYGKKSGNL